jgi:hypothetical protein
MLLRDCLLTVLFALPVLTLGSVAEDLKGTIAFTVTATATSTFT